MQLVTSNRTIWGGLRFCFTNKLHSVISTLLVVLNIISSFQENKRIKSTHSIITANQIMKLGKLLVSQNIHQRRTAQIQKKNIAFRYGENGPKL